MNIRRLSVATILFSFGILLFAGSMVETGKTAPDFSLTTVSGKTISLSDFKGKFVVLEWTNPGCPFVDKQYNSKNMQNLQKDMTAKGVVWLSICSSASGKQGDLTVSEWKGRIKKTGMKSTDVLLDREGTVGHLFGAKTTPHLFIVGPEGNLIYQGAMDDKPSLNSDDISSAKNYVRSALDEAMAGKAVSIPATTSYGCSVKYCPVLSKPTGDGHL